MIYHDDTFGASKLSSHKWGGFASEGTKYLSDCGRTIGLNFKEPSSAEGGESGERMLSRSVDSARSLSPLVSRLKLDGDECDEPWGRERMEFLRCGRRFGRVTVKSTTLRRPDEANTTSENTVPAHEISCPQNSSQRVMAIGKTYRT